MPNTTPLPNSHDWLKTLVSYDTTSRLSNLNLIHEVKNYLDQFDINSHLIFNHDKTKANLYATIGPLDRPGVMLSGHTDVVPVDGQQWHSDPFTLSERDGKWFGRGSCDMKGFIASVLSAVPAMSRAHLHTPIHLAFSYDEEVGCLGVRDLIAMLKQQPIQPKLAIIGEPSSMQAVIGHKGKCAFEVTVKGVNAHSAYPTEGVNAVMYAARLITYIHQIQEELKNNGPFDYDYRVPYTSLHVGTMAGGTAPNIVPEHCRFDFEIRHLPEQDPESIVQKIRDYAQNTLSEAMQKTHSESGIDISTKTQYPGLFTSPSHEIVEFVKSLISNPTHAKVSFGTEAGLFSNDLAIPAVVCGPGSILQAHKADEYVEIKQMQQCDLMINQLILSLSE